MTKLAFPGREPASIRPSLLRINLVSAGAGLLLIWAAVGTVDPGALWRALVGNWLPATGAHGSEVLELAGGLAIAGLVSVRVQRVECHPIERLARLASEISAIGRHAVRARRKNDAEIHALAACLNDLRGKIQAGEEQLARAERAAEDATRARRELLTNVSHEIRTPMNGIMGMTDLVLDTALTDEQREYMTLIKRSSESLLQVINNILDLARIDAGRVAPEPVTFSPRVEMDGIVRTMSGRARQKGLRLACAIGAEVPGEVEGDILRLRQVLMNLIGNAVKFTERGEVAIHVGARPGEDGRVRLRFAVRDTGIGIPDGKRDAIFKAFTQADGATTRAYGGLGLGLAISARLVECLGGQISVASEPGRGSLFRFSVLVGKAEQTGSMEAGMDTYVAGPIDSPPTPEAGNQAVKRSEPDTAGAAAVTADHLLILDGEDVLTRVDGDTELLAEILQLFLETRTARLSELRDACEASLSDQARKAAHAFKGALGSLGGVRAEAIAQAIETHAARGEMAAAGALVADLESNVDQLAQALSELLSSRLSRAA